MEAAPQNPFLGLKPYEPKDRQRLYGRDKDLFLMKDRIFSCRTTLLFAASGVGKTSFINAKIIPDLETQYSVIYHNQWSIGDPLAALEKSIATQMPGNPHASLTNPSDKSLLEYLAFARPTSENGESRPGKRCLIILDQFEEIFQYHSRQKYFERFIDELAEVINSSDCNSRVLFSMREEFLGELSIFDNKIPDLFNNYYRLKCPSKMEAEEIIGRTCSTVDVAVSEDKLKPFVGELTHIDKADLAKDGEVNPETTFERDIIAPPFLQIACQRLWDRQFVTGNGNQNGPRALFLEDYQSGDAHKMLRSFCHEILSTFNVNDRALLANAFDFLVTKKGAKMAYELSSLAEHMDVEEETLKSVLHKLSLPEKRILRETNAPNNSLWFELYHDMYGPIIDEWKRAYREQKRIWLRRRIKQVSVAALLIALILIGLNYVKGILDNNQRILLEANLRDPLDYARSEEAFRELNNTLGYGGKAKRLWADAWKRRATLAEKNENPEDALLSWLRAAAENPKHVDAALTAQIKSFLNSDDYEPLLARYRLENDGPSAGSAALFSADGRRLLGITNDLRVISWDVGANQPVGQSQPLDLARCKPSTDKPSNQQTSQAQPYPTVDEASIFKTQIQTAAGDLIGGLHDNNLCIWSAQKGDVVWRRSLTETSLVGSAIGGESNSYYKLSQASIAFSPDGRYFATVDDSGQASLYKAQAAGNRTFEAVHKEQMGLVASLQFSPDNRTLLLDQNKAVKLLDLETGVPKTLLLNASSSFRRITFNPDGSRLLIESGDGAEPGIWDTANGSLLKRITAAPTGPLGEVYFCGLNLLALIESPGFDANGKSLTIRFLNTDTNSIISTRTISFDNGSSYKVSSSGSVILIIPTTGVARLLSLAPRASSDNLIKDSAEIVLRSISDNGQVVATVNKQNMVRIWNAGDRSLRTSFQIPEGESPSPPVQGGNRLDQLLVSSTGKYIWLRRVDGRFLIWDTEQRRQILEAESAKPGFGRAVSFSENDDVIAIAGPGNQVTIWQTLGVINYPVKDEASRLQLSPDGKYLAVIYDYRSTPLRVFETTTGFERVIPQKVTSNIAFGRNGTFVAPIVNDNKLLVWNLATDSNLALDHANTITAVALNREGTRAVTSTSDRNLYLWDTTKTKAIASGKFSTIIRQLNVDKDGTGVLAFSDGWIHRYSREQSDEQSDLEYVDGKMIGVRDFPRSLDAAGQTLRLLFPISSDTVEVNDISFVPPASTAALPGTPEDLLEEWQRKLSLTFDDRGALVPLAPGGSVTTLGFLRWSR